MLFSRPTTLPVTCSPSEDVPLSTRPRWIQLYAALYEGPDVSAASGAAGGGAACPQRELLLPATLEAPDGAALLPPPACDDSHSDVDEMYEPYELFSEKAGVTPPPLSLWLSTPDTLYALDTPVDTLYALDTPPATERASPGRFCMLAVSRSASCAARSGVPVTAGSHASLLSDAA